LKYPSSGYCGGGICGYARGAGPGLTGAAVGGRLDVFVDDEVGNPVRRSDGLEDGLGKTVGINVGLSVGGSGIEEGFSSLCAARLFANVGLSVGGSGIEKGSSSLCAARPFQSTTEKPCCGSISVHDLDKVHAGSWQLIIMESSVNGFIVNCLFFKNTLSPPPQDASDKLRRLLVSLSFNSKRCRVLEKNENVAPVTTFAI
jgi:hypothetical protein